VTYNDFRFSLPGIHDITNPKQAEILLEMAWKVAEAPVSEREARFFSLLEEWRKFKRKPRAKDDDDRSEGAGAGSGGGGGAAGTRQQEIELSALIQITGETVLGYLLGDDKSDADLDVLEFGDFLRGILTDAHSQSAYLGRALAGATGAFGEADQLFGSTIMAEQESFLQKFLADIEDGRYTLADGTLDRSAINRRAQLYVNRIYGTANESWVVTQPEFVREVGPNGEELIVEVTYTWSLGAAEQHCPECPQIAGDSPYTAEQLKSIGYPGSANTSCLTNCRCSLTTSTGSQGFHLVA
jgi:hypothetical protein